MKFTIEIPDEYTDVLADAIAKRVLAALSTNTTPQQQKWLTHTEAAAYIRKTPAVLYKLTSNKELEYTKRGKSNMYRVESLDKYMQGGMVETADDIVRQMKLMPKRKYSLTNK